MKRIVLFVILSLAIVASSSAGTTAQSGATAAVNASKLPDTLGLSWTCTANGSSSCTDVDGNGSEPTRLSFSTTSANGAQCSFDGAAYASCTSPVGYTATVGTHTVSVRATRGSLVDPSPATASLTVNAGTVKVPVNLSPPTIALSGPADWTYCAWETEQCVFSDSELVRYGNDTAGYIQIGFTGGTECSNTVFTDPAVGQSKHCDRKGFAWPVQGNVLTASTGTWDGTYTYTYQWSRCDANGGNCAPITGATAQTYTPVAADVGSTIRVSVTASN